MGEGSSSSQRMSFCTRRKLVGKGLTSQDLLTERNVEDREHPKRSLLSMVHTEQGETGVTMKKAPASTQAQGTATKHPWE